VGRERRRAGNDQEELLRLVCEDACRLAFRLHPPSRTYTCEEIHPFASREHVEKDQFKVVGLSLSHARRLTLPAVMERNAHMADHHNSRLKLPPAFPQALGRYQSKFGLFIRKGDSGLSFFNYHSSYVGRHALNILIGDSEVKWLNDDEIYVVDSGLRIRSENPGDLDALMEKQLSPIEAQWEMPEPYNSWYRKLSGQVKAALPREVPQIIRDKPKREKSNRSSVPRTSAPSGLVSINTIASQLSVGGRDCRQALRKMKVEKPAHGNWAWEPSVAEEIKAKLAKALTRK